MPGIRCGLSQNFSFNGACFKKFRPQLLHTSRNLLERAHSQNNNLPLNENPLYDCNTLPLSNKHLPPTLPSHLQFLKPRLLGTPPAPVSRRARLLPTPRLYHHSHPLPPLSILPPTATRPSVVIISFLFFLTSTIISDNAKMRISVFFFIFY